MDLQTNQPEASASGLLPTGHGSYAGIYRPEYKQYTYNKTYNCPQCKKIFSGKRVFRSKLIPSKAMRYDLRKYFIGFDSAWYDVITCPHCWFSMFMEYYTEPKAMNKQLLSEKLGGLHATVQLDLEAERDLDTVFTTHYLALNCADAMWDSENIKLKLWSNLSWLYEDEGNRDMEIYACRQAAEAGSRMYGETKLTPLQEQVTCLVVAGMMYRGGEREGLRQWLFKAKTMKGGKKAYSEMAEDLMEEIRQRNN